VAPAVVTRVVRPIGTVAIGTGIGGPADMTARGDPGLLSVAGRPAVTVPVASAAAAVLRTVVTASGADAADPVRAESVAEGSRTGPVGSAGIGRATATAATGPAIATGMVAIDRPIAIGTPARDRPPETATAAIGPAIAIGTAETGPSATAT